MSELKAILELAATAEELIRSLEETRDNYPQYSWGLAEERLHDSLVAAIRHWRSYERGS